MQFLSFPPIARPSPATAKTQPGPHATRQESARCTGCTRMLPLMLCAPPRGAYPPLHALCASFRTWSSRRPLPHIPLSRRSRRARALWLLPVIGRSLGISGSRSAQGAAACRLGSKGLRSSAFRSYVRSGDAQTQGTQGFEPPGDSYVALEVGVLQGGVGDAAAGAGEGACQQQHHQQQQQKARARSAVARARRLCAGARCMCVRMVRSEPQPSPAASAHATWEPVQSAQ